MSEQSSITSLQGRGRTGSDAVEAKYAEPVGNSVWKAQVMCLASALRVLPQRDRYRGGSSNPQRRSSATVFAECDVIGFYAVGA